MKKDFLSLLIIMIVAIPVSKFLLSIETPVKSLPVDEVYYTKIINDIPQDAVYNGYKIDYVNNKTILYYMFKGEMHTVHIHHPEDNFSKEVDFYSTTHVEYN